MSKYSERVALTDRWGRHVKRAITYLGNAEYGLTIEHEGVGLPTFLPTEYWTLLEKTLDVALAIIQALPDERFADDEVDDIFGLLGGGSHRYNASDEWLEQAQKLVAEIERRRRPGKMRHRIAALENTTGRTPEEAELYRAKAAKLRQRAVES